MKYGWVEERNRALDVDVLGFAPLIPAYPTEEKDQA